MASIDWQSMSIQQTMSNFFEIKKIFLFMHKSIYYLEVYTLRCKKTEKENLFLVQNKNCSKPVV